MSEFQALKLEAVPVVADAKRALPALMSALDGYRPSYTDEIKTARDRWFKELDRLHRIAYGAGYVPEVNDANAGSADRFAKDLDASLTQTAVLGCINFEIAPEDVVIGSAGSLPGDMQRMWCARGEDTYNMEYGYSCMGYEISGALGVKYAIGDRDVYAMVGDGSFLMLHSELLTAVQEHQKINVCLFNNASFGCINNLQVGHGNDTLCTELRFRGEDGEHSGSFMPVDFAKIAEGYGCRAFTVRSLEELRAAMVEAKKIEGVPVLFDIRVLPKSMTDGYGSWWRVGDRPRMSGSPIFSNIRGRRIGSLRVPFQAAVCGGEGSRLKSLKSASSSVVGDRRTYSALGAGSRASKRCRRAPPAPDGLRPANDWKPEKKERCGKT